MFEINKALKPSDEMKSLREMLPPKYHEFLPLFEKAAADKLLPHRIYDH